MSLLFAALALPCLFWSKGPETADELRRAGVEQICVTPQMTEAWKSVSGISVRAADPAQRTKIPAPSVSFRSQVASATTAPWVSSNGWRFLRQPDGKFYYDAAPSTAPLAAAEAFMFGADAAIHVDSAGLAPLSGMLAFLRNLGGEDLQPLVNIGFIDDGSPASGEFMNLLVRRNLLFRVVSRPDPKLDLTVRLGTPDYPRADAGNPSLLAEKVRAHLGDEKRLLRIYGSEIVVGRLMGNREIARLYLINYGAARSSVHGVRIRVLGKDPKQKVEQYGSPGTDLQDVVLDATGTEFTLPELKAFAVISLTR